MSQITVTEDQKSRSAQRLRRPTWRDPRLILGVLIVVLSVAGVLGLLTAQDRTVPVYAADRPLSTGDHLQPEDLRTVHVYIPEAAERYVSAEDDLPEGLQLTRMVGQGEMLPAAALTEVTSNGLQAVTVQAEHDLARAVQPGRLVDVWAAAGAALSGEAPDAAQLVTAAEVTDVRESSSTFAAEDSVTVELLVASEELSELLTAQGEGAVISVLPSAAQGDAP
ncbi:SAF domain-containing protein [Garicola koreensis]|uniref:Cytoskeletal protein RodZ n=1 Tax=Garicola koreensis TaxID=1262554 RepID=A0A7W5TVP8_9MICC|nr:SAF domain-containing protein [Garicola koreensis]MBB3667719.1 cytoskeletal protein RodZ [Garicola koreensis]